jgi:hypothetical protein
LITLWIIIRMMTNLKLLAMGVFQSKRKVRIVWRMKLLQSQYDPYELLLRQQLRLSPVTDKNYNNNTYSQDGAKLYCNIDNNNNSSIVMFDVGGSILENNIKSFFISRHNISTMF